MDFLNFNSIEKLPGYEAHTAFAVNSSSVFKKDVNIMPTIVDDTLSYVPWGGDNQMPFDCNSEEDFPRHIVDECYDLERSMGDLSIENSRLPICLNQYEANLPSPRKTCSNTAPTTPTRPIHSTSAQRNFPLHNSFSLSMSGVL